MNENGNNNGNNKNPKNISRRPPIALFVWVFIFMIMGTFLIFRGGSSREDTLTPAQFEEALYTGKIVKAVITPESDRILYITGKYRKRSGDPDPVQYVTRIYATDKIVEKLQSFSTSSVPATITTDTVKAQPSDTDNVKTNTEKSESVTSDANAKLRAFLDIDGKMPVVEFRERDSWWQGLLVNVVVGILIIAFIYFLLSRQLRGANRGAMQFGKSRARMIMPDEHRKKFDDVAGCDEAKEETKEIVDYLKDPIKFKLLGGKIPHGALLTGPPGTGKTLMAKAVAGEASVPFFAISGSDFVEMFVGVGASRVRDMFDQARKHAPCLIFIDEIDAVGRSRFSGIGGGHDEREQTLNQLLVEMDGLETQEGVIVLAATNRPDVLDPALLRPGRFDRQIVIDLPDIQGRRMILNVHAKTIKLDPSVDLDPIAKSTPGFSGADIANLINEAALLAARNGRQAAIQADLEEARDKVCFGRERRSRKIPDHERKLTAWHEAGHTIVNLFCEHSIPLHKVTIIPRGQALGLTMMMQNEDRYSKSMLEMLDEIATLMGGRIAEEIVFGDVTSGASQDISHATMIAHAMVCAYGMSPLMGPVKYGERSEHIYVGRDITRNEGCSEQTLREIDSEVKRIVTDQKTRAEKILTENRVHLEALANALLEKETMSAKEIRILVGLPADDDGASTVTNDI